MNIVIVDDSKMKRDSVKNNCDSLLDGKVSYQEFGDYQSFMRYLKEKGDTVDLLFLDWHFPTRQGGEAEFEMGRNVLLQLERVKKNIPTVVFTSENKLNLSKYPNVIGQIFYDSSLNLRPMFSETLQRFTAKKEKKTVKKSSFNKVLEKLESNKQFKEQIHKDDSYMVWLSQFMKEEGFFDTNFSADNLTEEDKKRIACLPSFYEVIEEYAMGNYIYPIQSEFSAYYPVQYQGTCYCIGFESGQGVCFFCEQNEEDLERAISFEDIQKGIKTPRAKEIDKKLEQLVALMAQLEEEKVPLKAISDITLNELKKMKVKEKNS